jgi:branched-chain amino acid transport system substrate-binding protein
MNMDRRDFLGALGAGVLAHGTALAQAGNPIRIGGSLALTGPFAATGLIHKLAGEIFVEDLNQRGGLLGRKVEWVLKDDQSKTDLARTLYEQLITVDKVDLLIGPYATGAILSAMGVAQRYNKTLVHHTFGIPKMAAYGQQFPTWSLGPHPEVTTPGSVFAALEAAGKKPKTVAIVTSKFPSVQFVSAGAREVAKKLGVNEVLFLEWDFGNQDFGPIASRIKEANADLLFVGALGMESNQLIDALKKIDHKPRNQFHLYPAPGPMLGEPAAEGALSVTLFEGLAPFTDNPVAARFVNVYRERAIKANLPATTVDTQASASYSAWQVIEASVVATKSLDDKAMADWLRANRVDTIQGKLRFNDVGNTGDDLGRIKQIQGGKWVVVYPNEWATPGVKLR